MSYRRYKANDKSLIFSEYFNDEQSVRRNGGVPTDVVFERGIAEFSGSPSKILIDKINLGTVHSARVKIKFNTLPGNTVYPAILGNSTTSAYPFAVNVDKIYYNNGTSNTSVDHTLSEDVWVELIVVRNGTSVKYYLDGTQLSTEQTLSTNIDTIVDQFGARINVHFIEADLELFEIYNKSLTAEEVSNLYNDARYVMPQLDTAEHQRILHVTAQSGVVLEKTDQNTITTTDISVFKDGEIRVIDFNSTSSFIESTLADNVNTIMFWAKPKTADESIIDLGGGNTISIVSDVLIAAWADDLYVGGASGTAIKHNEWNLIVCRVDSALALTDIDIGKISAVFYKGLLDAIIFVEGVVSDAEISQIFTSQKALHSK